MISEENHGTYVEIEMNSCVMGELIVIVNCQIAFAFLEDIRINA